MNTFDTSPRSPTPERLRDRLFIGADAVAEGLISPSRLRREFQRVLHGVYAPAGTRADHGIRCLAALLRVSPEAALTAHSAAWWYGVTLADTSAPVLIVARAMEQRSSARGIKLHHTDVDPGDVRVVEGVRVTSPIRAAWDAATLMPPRTALATVDGLLRVGALSSAELARRLHDNAGRWGVERARAVFALADGRSESPAESWTRWILHQAPIPPPIPQYEVLAADGTFVARVDFAWPEHKVILEYDGEYHDDEIQRQRDQRRQARLIALGWKVLRMAAADLRDPSRILRELSLSLTA